MAVGRTALVCVGVAGEVGRGVDVCAGLAVATGLGIAGTGGDGVALWVAGEDTCEGGASVQLLPRSSSPTRIWALRSEERDRIRLLLAEVTSSGRPHREVPPGD